jgi:hypothetical protein
MKKVIAAIVLAASVLACTSPKPKNQTLVRCRIVRVEVQYPYGGVFPDKRYTITTEEGYVVYAYNRRFEVGDTINVQVINLRNQ